jgi:hypothetical protein
MDNGEANQKSGGKKKFGKNESGKKKSRIAARHRSPERRCSSV